VIIDRQTGQVTYTGLYYYLAHFSKFVRPGAVRIGATGKINNVRCLAFQNQDRQIVVQLINSAGENSQVGIEWGTQYLSLTLPAMSITTCLWNPASSGK
jgi:glucosylceramidase